VAMHHEVRLAGPSHSRTCVSSQYSSSRLFLVIQFPEANLPISSGGHDNLAVGPNRQAGEGVREDPEFLEDNTAELAITADLPGSRQVPDMDGHVPVHPEQIPAIWR